MDAWHRAITFMRMVDERAAEEVVPYSWGRALVNRSLKLVHDLNYLIADRPVDVTADVLVAEADRIQGERSVGHRRVNVDDQEAAVRLASGFAERGYQAERFVIMAYQRTVQSKAGDTRIDEVDWKLLRPVRRLERLRRPWGTDELVDQILAKHELTARHVKTRYFAGLVEGQVASSCELRTEAGVAQIETVETLEEFRNRGLARAVLNAALEAVAGEEFVFLVADLDDWPQEFYRRLGFDDIGIESRFLRLIDG